MDHQSPAIKVQYDDSSTVYLGIIDPFLDCLFNAWSCRRLLSVFSFRSSFLIFYLGITQFSVFGSASSVTYRCPMKTSCPKPSGFAASDDVLCLHSERFAYYLPPYRHAEALCTCLLSRAVQMAVCRECSGRGPRMQPRMPPRPGRADEGRRLGKQQALRDSSSCEHSA